MESRELARQLLVGSAEIDRMKKEIDSTVRMILGFIEPELRSHKREEYIQKFSCLNCYWEIYKTLYGYVDVWCWWTINDTYFRNNQNHSYYMSTYQQAANYFNLREVQVVYTGLPGFVEMMLEKFPVLADRWQPLIRAAESAK